jgi:hypothetical protein
MLCSGVYTVDCACNRGVAVVEWRGKEVEWIRDCVCCFAQVAPALGLSLESQTLPMKAGVVSVCEKGCQCISYIQSVGLGSSHDWSRRLGSGQYCWQCTARLVRRLSILL